MTAIAYQTTLQKPFARHFRSVMAAYVPSTAPVVVWQRVALEVILPGEFQLNFMNQVKSSPRSSVTASRGKVAVAMKSLSVVLVVLAIGALSWIYLPGLVTRLWPTLPQQVVAATSGSVLGGAFDQGAIAFKPAETTAVEAPEVIEHVEMPTRYLPDVDENLPQGSWIMIPKIGVVSELQWTETADEALDTGIWAVPEYGLPGSLNQPMIVAAHRYGYKWMWEGDYWKYHTFNLLPDTEPGDIVEIVHDQRKWTYEIYAGELNQEITDYSADLILYTCRFVTGDDRYIRYARLVQVDQDSQI